MRFLVIQECIDIRTGKRFFPGDEFLPAPDERQADRLHRAGCIDRMPDAAPDLPQDDLDAMSYAEVLATAKREGVDLGTTRARVDVEALIRTRRAVGGAVSLDGLDHDALVAQAASEGVEIAADAGDDAVRAAITAKRTAA